MQVVKIQPQTFKSSYIKLIVLLWSLVSSLIPASIRFISIPSGDDHVRKIFIPIVFIIFGVVYLITVIAYILIRNVRKDCESIKVIWLVDIAYFTGGILYYAGRNFPGISGSCDICISIFLLGTSVVLYRFIPFFISMYYQSNLAKEHQTTEAKLQLVPEWILAAESLTLLVEFDAWYSVMISSFSLASHKTICDSSLITKGTWVLWFLFVLMYMFILYYTTNIQTKYEKCNVNRSCVTSNLCAIFLWVAFATYLLANNSFILACSGVNLVSTAQKFMRILVLIVVITAIVLLLVYRCLSKTRQEKLLSRALYQHLHPDHDEQNDLLLETVMSDEEP